MRAFTTTGSLRYSVKEDILFATGNAGKVREAGQWFESRGMRVIQALDESGQPLELIEPQSASLEDVAHHKIDQAVALLDGARWVLVEDAGLFIPSLGDFPGAFSAHALDTIGCDGILRLLFDGRSRRARFEAVACLWMDGRTLIGHGVCEGRIASAPSGLDGFGFDPIFVPVDQPEGSDMRTFGSMTPAEKSDRSHRSFAYADLVEQLARTERPA